MDSKLLITLDRLAQAHEKLAAGVHRIADALTYQDGRIADISATEAVVFELRRLAGAVEGHLPPDEPSS